MAGNARGARQEMLGEQGGGWVGRQCVLGAGNVSGRPGNSDV